MFWQKLQAVKAISHNTYFIYFTEQAFSDVERHAYEYSSLKHSEFILAFQLQFGTYEAESEHFRWEKENAISTSGFQDK